MAREPVVVDRTPAPAQVPAAPLPTDIGPHLGFHDGVFVAGFGALEYRLDAAHLAQKEIKLSDLAQPIPGLQFKTARFTRGDNPLKITAGLAVPHLAEGDLTVLVDHKGTPKLSGQLHRRFTLPALGRTSVTLTLDEAQALSAEVEVHGADLAPKALAGLKATGSGVLHLAGKTLSGEGTIALTYADLGHGDLTFGFDRANRRR